MFGSSALSNWRSKRMCRQQFQVTMRMVNDWPREIDRIGITPQTHPYHRMQFDAIRGDSGLPVELVEKSTPVMWPEHLHA